VPNLIIDDLYHGCIFSAALDVSVISNFRDYFMNWVVKQKQRRQVGERVQTISKRTIIWIGTQSTSRHTIWIILCRDNADRLNYWYFCSIKSHHSLPPIDFFLLPLPDPWNCPHSCQPFHHCLHDRVYTEILSVSDCNFQAQQFLFSF
jgi:hypothetical protein